VLREGRGFERCAVRAHFVLKTLNEKVHILSIPLRFRMLREGRGFERRCAAVRAHFGYKGKSAEF